MYVTPNSARARRRHTSSGKRMSAGRPSLSPCARISRAARPRKFETTTSCRHPLPTMVRKRRARFAFALFEKVRARTFRGGATCRRLRTAAALPARASVLPNLAGAIARTLVTGKSASACCCSFTSGSEARRRASTERSPRTRELTSDRRHRMLPDTSPAAVRHRDGRCDEVTPASTSSMSWSATSAAGRER